MAVANYFANINMNCGLNNAHESQRQFNKYLPATNGRNAVRISILQYERSKFLLFYICIWYIIMDFDKEPHLN